MRRICIGLILAGVLAGSAGGATRGGSVDLVAYSTPKDAYTNIIGAFQKTAAGSGVSVNASYAASGDQARSVAGGLSADLVALALDPDIDYLVTKNIVPKNWRNANRYHGIVSNSVVVFVVRDGNPKKIKSWNDLLKPGVEVVTPNPFTAGIAKWNILAAYGAQRHLGKTDKQAIAFVKKLFDHVVSQDSSGSNATNTFLSGKGDVLITFESEAINARLAGRDIQYVIPRQTMLIELLVAVLKKSPSKDAATAFIRYMKSHPAQVLFGQNGFRPIEPAAAKQFQKQYPVRPGMFTINDKVIGGWRAVDKKWFNPTSSIMATIEKNLGVSTSGA